MMLLEAFEEMINKQLNVVVTLAQWRHFDFKNGQSVVEILSEPVVRHGPHPCVVHFEGLEIRSVCSEKGAATAAFAIERLLPGGEPMSLELPVQLAEWLSPSGDRTLVLSRPRTLLLTPIALLPFLIATAWRSLVDLPWWQVILQLLLRLLLPSGPMFLLVN